MIADNRIHSISLMYIIIANNLFLTFLFKIPGADIVSNPAENFLRFEQMGQDLTEWPEEEFGHIRTLSDIAAKYLPA